MPPSPVPSQVEPSKQSHVGPHGGNGLRGARLRGSLADDEHLAILLTDLAEERAALELLRRWDA